MKVCPALYTDIFLSLPTSDDIKATREKFETFKLCAFLSGIFVASSTNSCVLLYMCRVHTKISF